MNTIDEKLVWAPYKSMGVYEAIPLAFGDDRMLLENKKKVMKQEEKGKKGNIFYFLILS